MGLISTEVEVNLYGKVIDYYDSLGYEIPRVYDKIKRKDVVRLGTTIMVKIEDLSCGSHIPVKVKCDGCGKKYEMPYNVYHKYNHQGKIYCQHCAVKTFHSGENHYKWKPDKSDTERIVERRYAEYTEFVKKVLARDNYTCQCCGKKSVSNLAVHHLDSYNWCKDKRTDVTNGITLCDNCHDNFHLLYGKGDNTREQFEEWLGYTIPLLDNCYGDLPIARQVYDIEENKVYKSAIDYSETHKVQKTIVYSCCNHKIRKQKTTNKKGETKTYYSKVNVVAGHHLLWYDEYLKMSNEDLDNYIQQTVRRNFVKVICVTTGKIFNSIVEAGCYYKINPDCITHFCRGKNKSAGILPDGTKLKWMYYNEFINLSQKEQDMILNKTT